MDKDLLDDYKYEVNNNGSEENKREQIIIDNEQLYSKFSFSVKHAAFF